MSVWSALNERIPERPTWRMFLALIVLVFVGVVLAVRAISGLNGQIDHLEVGQTSAKERGFALSAHTCMAELLAAGANDITLLEIRGGMTDFCLAPERLVYYSPAICRDLLPDLDECGTKADDPGLG